MSLMSYVVKVLKPARRAEAAAPDTGEQRRALTARFAPDEVTVRGRGTGMLAQANGLPQLLQLAAQSRDQGAPAEFTARALSRALDAAQTYDEALAVATFWDRQQHGVCPAPIRPLLSEAFGRAVTLGETQEDYDRLVQRFKAAGVSRG